MVELIATLVISASSILLFGYWFRYTCMLVLSAKTARDYARDVATANQLGFLEVQSALSANSADLDRLRDMLDRDYAVLSQMLGASSDGDAIENKMLGINYKVMGAWSRVSGRFSGSMARRALDEMSAVVAHMANAVGESASCAAAA